MIQYYMGGGDLLQPQTPVISIEQKKPDQEVHTLLLHFYEVENQTKLIHGDRSQDTTWLPLVVLESGEG